MPSLYVFLFLVDRSLVQVAFRVIIIRPREPAEPDEGVSGAFKVQLKLPSGKSVKRRFLPTNTIKELHAVALESLRSEGTDDGPFKLTTAFPVRSLSETEYFGKPLGECEVAGTQIIIRKLL